MLPARRRALFMPCAATVAFLLLASKPSLPLEYDKAHTR